MDPFEVPPSQFVKARDARVRELRRAGKTQDAARLAAARRPTLALWAANALARKERARVRELIERIDALSRRTGPVEMRKAIRAEEALADDLAVEGARLARKDDDTVRRRIREILVAAARGSAGLREELIAGRLHREPMLEVSFPLLARIKLDRVERERQAHRSRAAKLERSRAAQRRRETTAAHKRTRILEAKMAKLQQELDAARALSHPEP